MLVKPECISALKLRASSALGLASGQSPACGEQLRQVFADGEGVPDGEDSVLQHRHLARRGVLQHLFLEPRYVQGDAGLGEGNAGMLEDEPGPQGPGGIGLVADDESQRFQVSPPLWLQRLTAHVRMTLAHGGTLLFKLQTGKEHIRMQAVIGVLHLPRQVIHTHETAKPELQMPCQGPVAYVTQTQLANAEHLPGQR